MGKKVMLRGEACPVCHNHVLLTMDEEHIQPGPSGTETVADIHGLDMDPPHLRVLYVDPSGSVRSFITVKKILKGTLQGR